MPRVVIYVGDTGEPITVRVSGKTSIEKKDRQIIKYILKGI